MKVNNPVYLELELELIVFFGLMRKGQTHVKSAFLVATSLLLSVFFVSKLSMWF